MLFIRCFINIYSNFDYVRHTKKIKLEIFHNSRDSYFNLMTYWIAVFSKYPKLIYFYRRGNVLRSYIGVIYMLVELQSLWHIYRLENYNSLYWRCDVLQTSYIESVAICLFDYRGMENLNDRIAKWNVFSWNRLSHL